MIARRLLVSGGAATFSPPAVLEMVGVYNGTSADLDYDIGVMYSGDSGQTWTRDPGNPVLLKGSGGAWDDESLVQPSLFHDGSQWVLYAAGYSGTAWAIGRWTNPDIIADPTDWTADSNPILSGPPTFNGVNNPAVLLDGTTERIWYTALESSGDTTIGYAERAAGGSVSGVGVVLDVGSAGQQDDVGLATGVVVKVGSVWRVYYGGASEIGAIAEYRTCLATTTDPEDPGEYSKLGALSGLDGDVTLAGDGRTYQSNVLRTVIQHPNGSWIGFGTAFHPTDASGDEVSFRSTSEDGITWTAPTGPILPLVVSEWDDNSAENPSIVVTS